MEGSAAFDNSEVFEERRRMVIGTRYRSPSEEEAYQRLLSRMERLEHERQRAIVLYPIPLAIVIEEPADPVIIPLPLERRASRPSMIGRLWTSGVRWLKHPVAQWDV